MRFPIRLLLVAALVLDSFVQVGADARAATAPEIRMVALVNDARAHVGVGPVDLNRRLSQRAERNSRGMAHTHNLSHSGHLPSGMGEAVGAAPSLRAVLRALLRSSVHRHILLSGRYSSVGVGVVRSSGTNWVTLIFT